MCCDCVAKNGVIFFAIFVKTFIFAAVFSQASVAQLVEQLICNQQAGGSSPSTGSFFFWLKKIVLLILSLGNNLHLLIIGW